MTLLEPRSIGTSVARRDGRAKVTGSAPYAFEQQVDNPAYLHPVQATIARGRVVAMDTTAARAVAGVLDVLTVFDAPSWRTPRTVNSRSCRTTGCTSEAN